MLLVLHNWKLAKFYDFVILVKLLETSTNQQVSEYLS